MTMSRLSEGISIFSGRRSETFWFYQDNVAASQTTVALKSLGDAVRTEFPGVRDGSVTGITIWSNEARTGGTATVDATINGSVTGLTAVLDATNTTVKSSLRTPGTSPYTADQRIGVKITTSADWTPTTADIIVGVEVTY